MTDTLQVVYLDDEPPMIELVRQILTRQLPFAVEVHAAHRGDTGLALIGEIMPHLILLDIYMPGLNGWQVYEHLKSNAATDAIPIIIVTTNTTGPEAGFEEYPVEGYVVKPFRAHELVGTINAVLGLN